MKQKPAYLEDFPACFGMKLLNCIFNDLTPSKLVNFRRTCTMVRNMGVLKGFI